MSAATPSPVPRRVALPRWVDARVVAGFVLVLSSVLVGARVVSRAEARTPVLAFTHDLAAGTTIGPADLMVVRAGLPANGAVVYLDRRAGAEGMQLTRPVVKGELVTRAAVHPASAATTVVVPLPAGAAPELHRGDRIVVWSAQEGCAPSELIADASVQDVTRNDDGTFGSGTGQRVVVELSDAQAAEVVAAMSQDEVSLRAGVLVGAPRTQPRTTSSAEQCRSG